MNEKDEYGRLILVVGCLLLASVLSGCGDSEQSKIVGTWEIETADKLMDRIDEESIPEAEQPPAMTVRFYWNGSLTTSTRMGDIQREKFGEWEFVSSDPEAGKTVLRCTLSDQSVAQQTTDLEVTWIDDDTIKMTPPNMAGVSMKLKFVRKR